MIRLYRIKNKIRLDYITSIHEKPKKHTSINKKNILTSFLILIFLIIVILIGLFKGEMANLYSDISKFIYTNSKNPNAQMLILILQIMGVFAIICTVYYNIRTISILRSQLENQNNNTNISRFESGYKLLGKKDEYSKIGGIYLLHEIAKENKNLKKSIYDILCNYFRENSKKEITFKNKINYKYPESLQTIINLLFKYENNHTYYGLSPNLNGSVFVKTDLNFCNFRNATFENCYFYDVEINYSDFIGAKFTHTKIINHHTSLYMNKTNLCRTQFTNSEINNAFISNAICFGAIFNDSQITDCVLSNQNYINVNFIKTKFIASFLDNIKFVCCSLNNSLISNCVINDMKLLSTYLNNLSEHKNIDASSNELFNKYSKMSSKSRISFTNKLKKTTILPIISKLTKKEIIAYYKKGKSQVLTTEISVIGNSHLRTKELVNSRQYVYRFRYTKDKYLKKIFKFIKFNMKTYINFNDKEQ